MGMRVYVEEGGLTKGREEMFLSGGYSPNPVVVVVSREYIHIRTHVCSALHYHYPSMKLVKKNQTNKNQM